MAITYRARDTVLNSEVGAQVIDRTVAGNPACARVSSAKRVPLRKFTIRHVAASQSLWRTRWRVFLCHGIVEERRSKRRHPA